MMVDQPTDPRAALFCSLRGRLMPPPNDAEAKADRRLLRRIDLQEAVRK